MFPATSMLREKTLGRLLFAVTDILTSEIQKLSFLFQQNETIDSNCLAGD